MCLLGYSSQCCKSEYVSSALFEKETESGRQSGGGMLPCVRSVNVIAGSRDRGCGFNELCWFVHRTD